MSHTTIKTISNTHTHTHTVAQSHTHTHTMAHTHTLWHNHTHTHRGSHTHTHTQTRARAHTLHVLFKRHTATGIKEFLNLFVLQMGHLRRWPDGRVVNSWFKIWSFFVKIERAFRKICCSQKRAGLWGTAIILEAIRTILCRLFLFFTPKLWNQLMKENDRTLSIKDL